MQRGFIHEILIIGGLAVLMTAFSLVLHVTSPSSIHELESDWQARLQYHQSNDAFMVRPLTTVIVASLHDALHWPVKTSFFVLQFFLLLISGPVFYAFLKQISFGMKPSCWGMILYYLSLPVVMAHFDPVYTWDDFWVYIFIPLSFYFLLRRAYVRAMLACAAALIARETTIFFLPVWIFAAAFAPSKKHMRAVLLAVGAILPAIGARLCLAGQGVGSFSFKLQYNFSEMIRTRDTLFSLFVSLGFLWVVGLYQAALDLKSGNRDRQLLSIGALTGSIGFVLATLLFAQARETRLFFPPFVFLIPSALFYFQNNMDKWAALRKLYSPAIKWLFLIIIIIVSIGFTRLVFPDFEFRTWKDGNRAIFALQLAATMLFLLFHFLRPTRGILPFAENSQTAK